MASSQTPVPSTETTAGAASTVTDEQWKGMLTVLQNIYAYRTEDGEDPSKLFHRKVNKRSLPDYYEVIKEPMALSTIKAKINGKEYLDFAQFVRDFALIPHNAQVYNRPDSGAYQDALIIRNRLQEELKTLVGEDSITEEIAALPYLGEIPPQDDIAPLDDADGDEEEEDEEDEEEDDDEEADDSEGDSSRRKRKRGARHSVTAAKRDTAKQETKGKEDDDPEARKKRGRPPRVDTPLEARIKNIVKGMRKSRTVDGELRIIHFERLPDKAVMPEYFAEIRDPISMDVIKRKLKRKKYPSVDVFMKDIELMFENAKSYNTDESQIYKDAVELQKETRGLAEEEKSKPDSEYAMEDGRMPLPNGILHNGELWKVGDWVHIQNANDLTKPIVAQIYRTWQDQDQNKWVNACWYYRPEQTVHRFDRHFYESEVVKTGQYRDHPIDEVIDRCFVMFFTRFNKGRPRGFPADKDIYVCESRYNEEKHKLNKIKTWASCVPDEVRDKDYEMDLYDVPKRMKKVPSPIKYLFDEGVQKETDDIPKPIWGASNAPPKIGAVHCRPRDPKDSPPPEPTPTPPPTPPPASAREVATASNLNAVSHPANRAHAGPNAPLTNAGFTSTPVPSRTPVPNTYTPHITHYSQQTASSAPVQALHHSNHSSYQATTGTPSTFPSRSAVPANLQYTGTSQPQSQSYGTPYTQTRAAHPVGYQAPQPVEVYRLPDNANDIIPHDIRRQFQCDEQGRVLFFITPPFDASARTERKRNLTHSAKYLAWRLRQESESSDVLPNHDSVDAELPAKKRRRTASDQAAAAHDITPPARRNINDETLLVQELMDAYKRTHGIRWTKALDDNLLRLQSIQEGGTEERKVLAELQATRLARGYNALLVNGLTNHLDYDP